MAEKGMSRRGFLHSASGALTVAAGASLAGTSSAHQDGSLRSEPGLTHATEEWLLSTENCDISPELRGKVLGSIRGS